MYRGLFLCMAHTCIPIWFSCVRRTLQYACRSRAVGSVKTTQENYVTSVRLLERGGRRKTFTLCCDGRMAAIINVRQCLHLLSDLPRTGRYPSTSLLKSDEAISRANESSRISSLSIALRSYRYFGVRSGYTPPPIERLV